MRAAIIAIGISPEEGSLAFLANLWDDLNSPADEAIEGIDHSKSRQWVAQFAPQESAPKLTTVAQAPLKPDEQYITVTAQKTVLPYDRVLFKRFYGAVHSTILMHDDTGEARSVTTFSSLDPTLAAIDKRAGEKMVQGPRTLLEFAPFRGTAIGSTIALLAIEAADYAKPLLSTLQKMSECAGIKFFSAAALLAEPLITGVQALSEVAGGNGTQIVYAGNLPLHTGIFLIAGIEAVNFNWADYRLASDYTLLRDGVPVDDFAYMAVTIEATAARPNWRQIPALRDAEAALTASVLAAGRKITDPATDERAKVENALLTFEWECLNTPDLCAPDGERVANLTKAKIQGFIERASAGLGIAASARGSARDTDTVAFSLEDIDPFDR